METVNRTRGRPDERVIAAWVGGSIGAGIADALSDIDLHVLLDEGDTADFDWQRLAQSISPLVLANPLPGVVGGFCLTPDFLHFDLVCHGPDDLPAGGDKLVLFNKSRFDLLGTNEESRSDPYFPRWVVDLFFYFLGNLVVVHGRGEAVLGMNGCVALRDACLVPLMLAENGSWGAGGAKRLRPLLTRAQYALLEALPPIAPDFDSIFLFQSKVATDFVARGKRLADKVGGDWPQALEDAARSHLDSSLGKGWGGWGDA